MEKDNNNKLLYGVLGGSALLGTLGAVGYVYGPKIIEKIMFYPSLQWDVLTLDTLHRYTELDLRVPDHMIHKDLKSRQGFYMNDPKKMQYINLFWVRGQRQHDQDKKEKKKEEKTVLIFAHGNAGNITHRQHYMKHLTDLGFDVVMFDYRGFGKSVKNLDSSFVINQDTTVDDLEVVYDFVKTKTKNIILFGESIGTGVICLFLDRVAKQYNPALKGVILQSGFSSMRDMAVHLMPKGTQFLSFLVQDVFDSVRNINSAARKSESIKKLPFMVIHSQNDELVPFSQSLKVLEALDILNMDYTFYEIQGGHNDPCINYEKIRSFIQEKCIFCLDDDSLFLHDEQPKDILFFE